MSYNGDRTCIDVFSRLQIAVMLYSIYRGKSSNNRSAWSDLRAEFDNYEMDNFSETARPILLNEIQERNFNQQYNGDGIWGQCDVDWVRFTAPRTINLEVFTSAITGRANANTRLTLFNNTLTQLVQNDNISATNKFSSINWNFVSGQQYFIRVENMSPNTTGYYNLKVGNPFPNTISISGNDNLCPSGNYLVNGLPAGATVSWSAWPLNVVSFSCTTCPAPTITRVGDGAVTITATVSVSICGTNFTKAISKQLYAGAPDNSKLLVTSQYVYAGNPVDLGVEFEEIEYCSLLNAGVTDVQWDIVSSYPFYVDAYYSSLGCAVVSNSGRTVSFSDGYGSYTIHIRVKVMNACGWSGWSAYFPINVIDDGWGFKVSPNPSTGSIMVTLNGASIKNKMPLAIREIQITDKLGNIVKKYQFGASTKSINLNIHDLKQDVYFIRVFNGAEWKIQSIFKK